MNNADLLPPNDRISQAENQRQETLLKTGALQRAIFNSPKFSSIATDARGVIQIFNVGAERMLGYTAAEVLNKITPADISDQQELITRAEALTIALGTSIKPGVEALVFKATRGIEDIYELTYIRKDGSRLPAVVSVTALRDAGEAIIGYLLIATDNTAGKEAEAIVEERSIQLENALASAIKANLAKSDFLSSMSHELRSPLNAILGFAQLLETDEPPPSAPQLESIKQILQAGWHLLKLINETLDLSKIESSQVMLQSEALSLEDMFLTCKGMIEPLARQRDIQMMFLKFEKPFYIYADRTRIKQIMINLLSNAIKYNRKQGSVQVSCEQTLSGRIRISIKDTGAGLTEDQLAQLFQPFNRLGQEGGMEEGTGIGLVVAKRLVELMHGDMGVESTLGEGSLFWVEFAAVDVQEKYRADKINQAVMPRQTAHGSRTYTVLYIEDNQANMSLVEKVVARISHIRLITAVDGALGVSTARKLLPDLILMDINLPGINGFEALKMLKEDALTTDIPVIALSANVMLLDIEKALVAGFYSYITKPIKVDQLSNTLNLAFRLIDKKSGMTG